MQWYRFWILAIFILTLIWPPSKARLVHVMGSRDPNYRKVVMVCFSPFLRFCSITHIMESLPDGGALSKERCYVQIPRLQIVFFFCRLHIRSGLSSNIKTLICPWQRTPIKITMSRAKCPSPIWSGDGVQVPHMHLRGAMGTNSGAASIPQQWRSILTIGHY